MKNPLLHLTHKNLDNAFGIFVVLSLLGLLLLKTEFNGGFSLALQYLAPPLFLLVMGAAHANRKKVQPSWLAYFFALVMWPLLVVFSWPLLLVANAAAADGSVLEFSGPVSNKFMAGTRSREHVVTLLDQATRNEVKISIPPDAWDAAKIGEVYKFCFFNGKFGVPYYWRFAGPPPC